MSYDLTSANINKRKGPFLLRRDGVPLGYYPSRMSAVAALIRSHKQHARWVGDLPSLAELGFTAVLKAKSPDP